MAEYIGVRALNRSAAIRIGKQRVTGTETTFVDISTASARKELAYHSSIGQLIQVNGLTNTNAPVVVQSGVTTNQGASAADLVVNTEPGIVRNRSTGAAISVSLTETTLSTADATNPRIDLIQVNYTTGVVSKVTGTPAASPVVKAAEEGNIAVANIAVAANATGIANNKITDVRPLA